MTVISNCVNLHKNLHLLEALHQLVNKNAVEPVATQKSLGFYNRLFLVPKPNNLLRPILDLSILNTYLPKHRVVQNGETRDNKNLPTGRGVGYLHRFQRRLLPRTNSQSVQEVHVFSCPWLVLPVQSTTLWTSTAPMEFTVVAKDVKLMALQRSIRINQYLDKFMSLIGLLTATEKQVLLGRLHMRPIQWHLKNNWRVPESLEKVIPVPRWLHLHLKWWLEESNVLQGQPLHPLKLALQIFTDASKEGWGVLLNEYTARGTCSLPESKAKKWVGG